MTRIRKLPFLTSFICSLFCVSPTITHASFVRKEDSPRLGLLAMALSMWSIAFMKVKGQSIYHSSGGELLRLLRIALTDIYSPRWLAKSDTNYPTSVVYKRAQRATIENSTALRGELLDSLVRELSALGRLRGHQHVIQLLGVAWETAPNVQPVLVLEYAPLGSLASVLSPQNPELKTFGFSQKRQLCLDIARGMEALHESGIIWGDCKPDNVLIFYDKDCPDILRAKVGDLGTCVPNPGPDTGFHAKSRQWNSPEHDTVRGFENLVKAEIFSYGLVAWAILMDGHQWDKEFWGHGSWQDNQESVLNVAVTAVQRYFRPTGANNMPLASKMDVGLISALLRHCIQLHPQDRSSDMSDIIAIWLPSSASCV